MRDVWLAMALVVPLLACKRATARYNASGLEKDVKRMAAAQGVTIPKLRCRFSDKSRTGWCRAPLTPGEIATLSSGWHTTPYATSMGPLESNGCQSTKWPPGAKVTIVSTARRSPHVGGFEYVRIFSAPGATEACIEASYAYG